MITLSKIKSSVIEKGKRIITVLQFGAKTAKECYPFGFDSSAPKGFTAIFSETSNRDEAIILGYINTAQLEELKEGESRMYALGSSGEVVGFVYARDSGVLELNGSDYSAVRYENLKIQLDSILQQINGQLPLIASGIATGGGVYTPTNITIDLTNTKSETVKLK